MALGIALITQAWAQSAPPKMKMTTEIPPQITTPDSVETRLGTLKFFDGFPDDATVQKVYDNLDFQRGVQAFLTTMPGASVDALRVGLTSKGANNQTVLIMENLMDSKSLFLTANSDTVYSLTWLDLKDGPLVIETPPNVLGIIDDHWFNYVGDVGNAGPDKGKGGKFLLLPPGYQGKVPEGYFVFRSPTFGNVFFWRNFLVNGDSKPAVEASEKFTKIYPLAQAKNRPPMKFINVSGKVFNTIHANDFTFFDEVNHIVQEEPNAALNPETLGLLASIGIEKSKPFTPDERMKKILTESAEVGNATARAILFKGRIKEAFFYPNSAWCTPFIGGSYEFLQQPGVRNLDARTFFFYYATGVTPAMPLSASASARNTPPRSWTPMARRSTAARPTRFICRLTFRKGTSGRSYYTTTRLARCSKPTRSSRALVARKRGSSSTQTAPSMCGSARRLGESGLNL